MPQIDQAWTERQLNRHYRQPSIQVLGVHCDRDRTVGEALSSRELGRLVRVHGQITLLSPKKTQFIEAAFHCSRCEDPEIHLVRQNPYDDELLISTPMFCSRTQRLDFARTTGIKNTNYSQGSYPRPTSFFLRHSCCFSRIPTGIKRQYFSR